MTVWSSGLRAHFSSRTRDRSTGTRRSETKINPCHERYLCGRVALAPNVKVARLSMEMLGRGGVLPLSLLAAEEEKPFPPCTLVELLSLLPRPALPLPPVPDPLAPAATSDSGRYEVKCEKLIWLWIATLASYYGSCSRLCLLLRTAKIHINAFRPASGLSTMSSNVKRASWLICCSGIGKHENTCTYIHHIDEHGPDRLKNKIRTERRMESTGTGTGAQEQRGRSITDTCTPLVAGSDLPSPQWREH